MRLEVLVYRSPVPVVGIILSMLVCAQTFHLDLVNSKTDK